MEFTEEHRLMRESLRQLIEEEINPHVDAWEEAKSFPAHDVFKKFGDAGFLGITKPEEYGGMDLDWSYAMVMAEELGRIRCGAVPMAIGVHTDMCTPALARVGSDELKREYLAPSIAGDLVGCIGVSESVAGSDVAGIKTTARKVGGDYVLDGEKMWITNGGQADWMCCLANTSEPPPGKAAHGNKSLIIVPLDAKGVERSRKLDKLGMWASDTAQIFFDGVKVPRRNLIGEEGLGFTYQMMQFQEERLWSAANTVTSLNLIIDDTIEYTRTREAFGRRILDNQVVHFRLAELRTEVEALRALVYRATELFVAGEDVTRLASMAKLKAGRLCREVADSCLQYWGGQGYMWESSVARAYRDGRLTSIGGGADEIMLGIICKLERTLPGMR
ncbi:MAG: acyl-CoA dehydrogenase family protein [Thermoanaerobaculia bacterium]